MKPYAILDTSNTVHTCQYAHLLGDCLGLPVYSLPDANEQLPKGSPVIYLGWIHASHIKGYSGAAKRFDICAVCGVGLCDTGTMTSEVRTATSIPENIPLFTLQGGLERSKLKGMDKLMISMLTKGLASQKQRSAQDDRMLELLNRDGSYVSPEKLSEFLQWYREGQL